ncbi:MAG: glycosyltransferase, partial [Wenzhouxiangellaceae bacterium]
YGGELEVVVVSDASEDATDSIVAGFDDPRVRLVRQEERLGKEAGQARGIREARGEIIVFTDVATKMQPGSLDAIAVLLSQPGVGAVSSEDCFEAADGRLVGEGLYVRYEMWLRRLESRVAGLVGLSGSFFAVRKDVVEHDWRTDVPSDFTVALTCARKGMKAVSDPGVVGIYADLKEPADEYARKRRTVLRGMAGLAAAREVLNPLKFGMFAFQVWSHKVMRWAVPWFLLLLFVTSLVLAPQGGIYAALLVAQLLGYGLALLGWLRPAARSNGLVRLAFYFCQVNLAMADALVRFLRGERIVTWEPSKR